ncbi:transglutaminase domain-containing protein, partial [Candidatus Pacearchaeota archaeon]|nr:transglutaminase domain-containing protein [Candidatus Pacearchaeota archaeon]
MCGRKTFLIAVIVIFLFIGGSAFAITPAKETQTNVLMPTGVTSTTSFNNLSSLLPAYQQSQDMMAVESSAGYDPEITELARGLKNDPNLIFKYVYNHIDHIPMHGSVKGAYMTLMDGFGNSYDQSSLLVALLRESGYTASFVYGFIYPDLATVMNWFGTQDEDTINEILSDSGIVGWVWKPSDLSGEYVVKTHVWVKVNINGTDYLLDPSLKAYEYTDGINLQTATGYNESTFLSSVLTNATVQTDYVKDINKSNLNSKLSTYSSNLISYINTNMPCAKLEDVIGGRKIIPITEVTWQTSLPYVLQVIEEWTDISDDHKHVLRVQHLITDVGDPNDPNDDVYAIDVNLYSEDIYGRRLTISYNEDAYGDVYPVLNLDGSVIDEADSSDAVSVGSNQKIKLSADHPYSGQSGTLHDSDRTTSIKAGGTYFVLNFWGNAPNLDIIEKHRNILKNYLDLGYSLYSEKVLGESSTIMGLTWVAEKFKFIEISNRVNNFRKLWHHGMGICGYYDSAYIDIFGYGTSTVSLSGDDTNEREYSFGIWGFGSALESGMIEQLQPDVNGISTVELINLANNNSHKIFHTTSSNYNSTIKPQLQNYSSGILSNIESMLNDGYELILPEYGDLVIDDWQGTGYLYYDGTNGYGAGYMISGGLNGGHSGSSSPIDTQSLHASTVVKPKNRSSKDHSKSWDPIDLVTGKYLYHNSDLQIGSGNYPFSLEFARYYNSISESQKGHMGQGWTHNFELTANSLSDGFQSLGIDSPIDAATAITTTYICMDLMVSDDSHRNIVIMTLAHQWLMDQMVNNTVLVQQPSNGMQFVKLPDGSYNPPPGDASTLSLEGDGSYSLRTKHGEYLDFDTDGRIEKWRDQHNNFVNFTYNYTDTLISSLDDDLVSHWKLNAYSTYGNGIVDSVGSNHGTLSNPSNVSLLAGEHIGNSLAFNNPNPQSNDNGGVIIGDDPSLELQEFTLSFWVKFDSMSSWNGG